MAALRIIFANLVIFPPLLIGTDGETNDITHLGDAQVLRRIRLALADLSVPVLLYLVATATLTGSLAAALAVGGVSVGPVAARRSSRCHGRATRNGGGRSASRWTHRFDLAVPVDLRCGSVWAAGRRWLSLVRPAVGFRFPIAGRLVYMCNRALCGATAGAAAMGVVALLRLAPARSLVASTVAAMAPSS